MYSTPYILFIIFLFFLSLEYTKIIQKKAVHFFIVIAYILFLGFRGYIGSDFRMYYTLYETLPTIGQGFFTSSYVENSEIEYGFLLYMSLLKVFTSNYSFFIFLNSLINISIILYFLKRYNINIPFALIIFLEIGGLIFEIDVLRNMKALLLFMLSIKYIEERKLIPFLFINMIGLMFHSSALIFIPLYWLLNKPLNLKLFWLIYGIGNILFFLKVPILSFIITPVLNILGGRYAILATNYLDTGVLSDYGMSIGFFIRIGGAILISVFYDKLIQYDKRMIIYINGVFIYLLVFAYFSEIRMLTLRLSNLFFFCYAIVFPTIYKLISNKQYKLYYFVTIFIIAVLKINGKVNSPIYEYDSVLFEHMSPEERSSRINSFYINLE